MVGKIIGQPLGGLASIWSVFRHYDIV